MEIKNNDLLWIKNQTARALSMYGNEGTADANTTRDNLRKLKERLTENLQTFKDRAHKKKFPNYNSKGEESKSRAMQVLSSGSMDLIRDSLKKERDNFDYIFSLTEAVFSDKKNFTDADRASLSNIYMDARKRSGYDELDEAMGQGQVLLKELISYENNIGTCGYSELLMKASTEKAPEEIKHVLRKEKLQTRPAYKIYEEDNKEVFPSVKEMHPA